MATEKLYYVYPPGWTNPARFCGKNEREVREAARYWLGVKRLPRNTAIILAEKKLPCGRTVRFG